MAWSQIVTTLAAISILSLITSGVSQLFVWVVVTRGKRFKPSSDSVSILKPLCGVDASLDANLAIFSRQTHADLQIVLGVADPGDKARGAAQRFCGVYDRSNICLGESANIINPKVALLDRMARAATGDWIAVSDSNVSVTEEYVAEALSHSSPDVGLITHLVCGQGGKSFAAHCENLQLNCFAAPAVCGARYVLARTCVIGKSMFLRREALAKIGGFRAAGNYLAEDYAMGQAIEKAGYRVAMSDVPIVAWHDGWTLSRFVNRHLRWAVMRRRVSTAAYLGEVLLTPAPWLMLTFVLAVVCEQVAVHPLWVLLALGLEWTLVAVTYSRMAGRRITLAAFLVNPVRELLTLAIWVLGWFVRVIEWRGKSFRVGKGSRLAAVTPPISETIADEAQA